MTKGYHNYRGRGRRQKRLLAVILVLVILAATAFLVIQNYIVYDDQGQAHIEWPFRKEEPQPDDQPPAVSDGDVTIDYIDNAYMPRLQELHARMLPGGALRQSVQKTMDSFAEDAFAVEVKRVNGSLPYATEVAVPQEVETEQGVTTDDLRGLTAAGRYAIARMSVFCDSYFVRAYPDAALHWEGGDFWYDDAGMAWLDPSHPQTLVYVTQLCQEYASLGFDEIMLDYFSYPTIGETGFIGGLADTDREEVLTDFVKSLRANLPKETKLSIVLRSDLTEESGLSAEMLAQRFDRVYVQPGVDLESLRRSLPEKFDQATRLVPAVTEVPESGSYLIS